MPLYLGGATTLEGVYRGGTTALVRKIADLLTGNLSSRAAKAALKDCIRILGTMNDAAREWVQKSVPQSFVEGWNDAPDPTMKLALDSGQISLTPASFSKIHTGAIEEVMYSAWEHLNAANLEVGRKIDDVYRQESIDSIMKRLFTGESLRETAKDLAKNIELATGIASFTDKAGRNWKLDNYAMMVARTTTREATTQGTLARAKAEGLHLVRISEHHPTCPLCAPLQGKVFSLDKADARYPLWEDDFCPVHPNCIHTIHVYSEEYDPDAEETRRRSWESLTEDPRSDEEKAAYATMQGAKSERRELREQYARYQARLGDKAGTIQTFARAKSAGGKKWDELQTAYRDAGAQVRAAAAAKAAKPSVPYPMINPDREKNRLNYEKSSLEDYAKKQGLSYDEYMKTAQEHMMNMNKNADIEIRTPKSVASKILQDGRFKSQFETQKSKGCFSPSMRADAEELMFAAPHNLDPRFRPIYGSMVDRGDSTNKASQYGDVRFIINKDLVAARTSFVYDDSLGTTLMPQMLNNPTPLAARGDVLKYKDLSQIFPYAEVQIHGGVTVNEIEKVILKEAPRGNLKKYLNDLKIPWEVDNT